ncbi:hypothetical protein C6499_19080 [Candidatus Poribacteria bacterium]|nr:MAG: hypothetical protein C6499_19080 [Candidatus Poribacteria bacterium]
MTTRRVELETIKYLDWPYIELILKDGTRYEGSMNDANRKRLDLMTTFPELEIEIHNPHHAKLTSPEGTVTLYLDETGRYDALECHNPHRY